MTDKKRIRVAAGVTAIFLASISAVGLATHAPSPNPAPPAAAEIVAAPAATPSVAGGDEADKGRKERDDHDKHEEHDDD